MDTHIEFPEVRSFVSTVENVTRIYPKMSYKEVIDNYGYPIVSKFVAGAIEDVKNYKAKHSALVPYKTAKLRMTGIGSDGKYHPSSKIPNKWQFLVDAPFKISDKCCNHLKISPTRKYERETGRVPFLGLLAEESNIRRFQFMSNGCNAYSLNRPVSNPLYFWTEQDILRYIRENNIKISKIYGDLIEESGIFRLTGEQRTGCIFCCFGVHMENPNKFQRMKITHPKHYDYCMNKLGLKNVLDFCKIPIE